MLDALDEVFRLVFFPCLERRSTRSRSRWCCTLGTSPKRPGEGTCADRLDPGCGFTTRMRRNAVKKYGFAAECRACEAMAFPDIGLGASFEDRYDICKARADLSASGRGNGEKAPRKV